MRSYCFTSKDEQPRIFLECALFIFMFNDRSSWYRFQLFSSKAVDSPLVRIDYSFSFMILSSKMSHPHQ